jgi:tetratricopeptide (TPR) repeat protein
LSRKKRSKKATGGRRPMLSRLREPTPQEIERALALCEQGLSLLNAGKPQEAIARLEEALSKVPTIENAHYVLALCHEKLGQPEEALAALHRELALKPGNQAALSLLERLQAEAEAGAAERQGPRPTISICMIVRNEEEHLGACLESVLPIADEIIVVDTGSMDNTVEIARRYGAQVRFFPWVDDFAAARNESIRDAKGDWILWMDADDRLPPESATAIRQLVARPLADVYTFIVVSDVQRRGSKAASRHTRLFRNGLGLHFVNRIHERLEAPPGSEPIRLAHTDIVVQHVGYDASPEVLRTKAIRNRGILLQCLAEEPGNLFWHYHLGVCSYMLGEMEEAARYLERVVEGHCPALDVESEVSEAHWLLAAAYRQLRRYEEAEQAVQRAIELFPNRRQVWVTAGSLYLELGRLEEAVSAFERALSLREGLQMGTTQPLADVYRMLFHCYLGLGHWAQAREAYLQWAEEQLKSLPPAPPADPGAGLQLAEELLAAGQATEIELLLLPSFWKDAGFWRRLSKKAEQSSQAGPAAEYLARALCLAGPRPGDLLQLALLHLRAGAASMAERVAQLATQQEGSAAAALNLLGSIAGLRGRAQEAISFFVRALVQDPRYKPAIANLEALGLSPAEALKAYGRDLLRQGQPARAAEAFAAALQLRPEDHEAYKLLAVALRNLGREEDALLAFAHARRLEESQAAAGAAAAC